jgi:hypothetical protein
MYQPSNPNVFPAHTEINVICTFSIKVEPSLQTTPYARCERRCYIHAFGSSVGISYRPLNATFAQGWHKLPCELKVKVLEHNLISDRPIRRIRRRRKPPIFTLSETLYAHLIMGPSIADLVPGDLLLEESV